jgi:hypothetical protein
METPYYFKVFLFVKMNNQEIEDAFRKISGQLPLLPDEFRYWKTKDFNGDTIRDSIWFYKQYFNFIQSESMKTNLSELRFCLDYHCSLFKLHKPTLTFEWHHKLVIFQILGSIYEGILYDFVEYKAEINKRGILNVIAREKINKPNTGLNTLKQILFESKIINDDDNKYIEKLASLRNTIHPKLLKDEKTSFDKNPLAKKEIDALLKDLNAFVENIKNKY